MNDKRWTSRKLWMVNIWAVVSTMLLVKGIIVDTIWFSMMLLTVGGYLGANVYQKRIMNGQNNNNMG